MRRWRRRLSGSSDVLLEPKCEAPCCWDESLDELLEQAWLLDEEGSDSLAELRVRAGDNQETFIETAIGAEMIKVDGDRFELLPVGRERARGIIRRHRLTETLFTQIFEMDEDQAESDACKFEHILSPEATDSICTLLGHPPTCPHGKLIPRGPCCEKFQKDMTPLVTPLTSLHPGEEARIVFIAPKSHARLDRLASLGIVPGSRIKLHQKSPTYVIQIGQTDVAIDSIVAGEIFVKRV